MKRAMKKTMWAFFVGGLLGGMIMTWAAPGAIAWYYDPGGELAISCRKSVEEALGRLQTSQLIGIIVGGVVAMIVGFVVFKGKEENLTIE